MKRLRLIFACPCGLEAPPISFWITDHKELLVKCFCVKCEHMMSVIFPLSELNDKCPLPDLKAIKEQIAKIRQESGTPLVPPLDNVFGVKDLKFLQDFHIVDEKGEL